MISQISPLRYFIWQSIWIIILISSFAKFSKFDKMKLIKFLILFTFLFNLKSAVKANSGVSYKIDSLKQIIVLKSDDLSHLDKGGLLSRIARNYAQLSDFGNSNTYNRKALKIFNHLKSYKNVIKVLFDLGLNEGRLNQYDKAMRYYFATLKVLEISKSEFSDKDYNFYEGMILMNIGLVYEETKNYNQALKFIYNSHEKLIKAEADSMNMALSYANLGLVHGALLELETAKDFHLKSIAYFGNRTGADYFKSISYNNLGYECYCEENYETAIKYYNKSLDIVQGEGNYVDLEIPVMADLSQAYLKFGDLSKAKHYLELSIERNEELGTNQFVEKIYDAKVNYFTAVNEPELAFANLKILNEIRDSLYNPGVLARVAHCQKNFDFEKAEKANQLNLANIENKRLLELYSWYIFTGVCGVVMLLIMLLYYKQRYKTKLSKVELINVKLEQEKMTNQLNFKNSQLTNYAMYILKKNEFLEGIKKGIDHIKNAPSNVERINELSSTINQHISSARDRLDFEILVEKENEDFYYRLHEKHPSLTEKDKKLCSLLLLELASKEIAALLNISVGSVEKSRHRLRKKTQY